jgi:hypothetical protein
LRPEISSPKYNKKREIIRKKMRQLRIEDQEKKNLGKKRREKRIKTIRILKNKTLFNKSCFPLAVLK